ncbi:MAG: ArsR/SmtB family transcription factor [Thiohalospira sp.]
MSNTRINTTDLAERLKALGNPHRLAVFRRLAECCAPGTVCGTDEASRVCVGDLGDGLDIAPSTLSHHLKELHRVGLIRMDRNGKRTDCWVEPAAVEELATFFTGLSSSTSVGNPDQEETP